MEFPKPPKTENKAHTVIKRTAIVRRPDWKPLRRSCAPAAKPARRTPFARSCKPLRATKPLRAAKPPKRSAPIQRCPIKSPVDFAVVEAKRLARKERRKKDRAIASHGKWPVVNGVMLIPDPLNPRGQREVCVTDAAWVRAQATIRRRSKDSCEDCHGPAPNGDAHHICGRAAGKRDDHPDALLNLCRRCHNKAKIQRRIAARKPQQQSDQEMNHGKAVHGSGISLERNDGDTASSSRSGVSSMLDAA